MWIVDRIQRQTERKALGDTRGKIYWQVPFLLLVGNVFSGPPAPLPKLYSLHLMEVMISWKQMQHHL